MLGQGLDDELAKITLVINDEDLARGTVGFLLHAALSMTAIALAAKPLLSAKGGRSGRINPDVWRAKLVRATSPRRPQLPKIGRFGETSPVRFCEPSLTLRELPTGL